jgi:hypothetical protein
MQDHEKKKESEKAGFYKQKNFFRSTLPFSPWAVSAAWLYVGAPQKLPKK